MMKRISLAGVLFAAILALSGIAVSSASAGVYQCYLVSNPSAEKEGQYETANCTTPTSHLLKGKWILALLIRPTVETLWCALVRLVLPGGGVGSGEDGAFKDEKCEKKLGATELNKGDYTEVILPKEPPEILPNPTFTEPFLLTSTSIGKNNILEAKAVGSKIECEKVVSEANFVTPNYGTGVLTFTGCKNASGKCFAPTTETHGTIKTNVELQLVDILPEKVLTLGVAIGPSESILDITCGTAAVLVEGAAIGEITGAKSGTKVKTAGLVFKQTSGVQKFTECDLPLTLCTGKVSLESDFGTKFEQSGEESEDTLTVVTKGKYTEGAAIDY